MSKTALQALIGLLIFAVAPLFANHVPEARSNELDYQQRIFITTDLNSWEPVAEFTGRIESGEFRYRSLRLGSYYRIHPNLKIGAFYTLQAGARHDDDWVGTPAHWWWQDTTDRYEQLLTLDVSPRFLVPFLPGKNWVFMLKNHYTFNTYNGQQSLLTRPGLTYIYLRGRRPILNFSLQYGLYFPLNFSDALIYEQAPYLDLLWHFSKRVKFEFFGAYTIRTWTESEDVRTAGESGYEVKDKVFLLGTGIILRF